MAVTILERGGEPTPRGTGPHRTRRRRL